MWAKYIQHGIDQRKAQRGFTIVELLIVIVVIGILAAITIVAYNGVQDKAKTSAVTSQLSQAAKKVAVWQVDNPGVAPASLATVGVADTNNVAFQYTTNTGVTPNTYCITATSGSITYYIDSTGSPASAGVCAGYNLLVWNKAQPGAPVPVPSATVDTAVFRTSTASMRIGPASTTRALQGNPYTGTAGQVYTVSFWLKTDANWDGTSSNSKIRFGDNSNGALLATCGYGGVKTSWTLVTCSYTMTAGVPQVAITVGNDGTVGNIWIDDFSLSRTN
jgi:prepilin-type N-terminal cleavage/methylation domain-containing protein